MTNKKSKPSGKNSTAKKTQRSKQTKGKQKNNAFFADMSSWFKSSGKWETARFILGLLSICLGLFLTISFVSFIFTGNEDAVNIDSLKNGSGNLVTVHNNGGVFGLKAANYFIQESFGFTAIFIPVFLFLVAMKLMKTHAVRIIQQFINLAFLMIWGSVLLASLFPDGLSFYNPGGQHGINISNYLRSTIGSVGLCLVLAITMLLFCIYITSKTIEVLRKLARVKTPAADGEEELDDDQHTEGSDNDDDTMPAQEDGTESETGVTPHPADYEQEEKPTVIDLGTTDYTKENTPVTPADETEDEPAPDGMQLQIEATTEEEKGDDDFERGSLDTPYDPKLDFEYYKYPPTSLLKQYPDQDSAIDMQEQQANKDRIITVLRNFGVEISSIKATVGPTITLYEITPARGVRIARIKNLEDDIALSLSAIGIRIIAPIPGKGTIGIEVPNAKPKIVSMESVINSRKFQECNYELPIALGRTITNEIYIQDLAKMPHLLVAGATGQGKSVGLNAIISSLLYKKHPTELKLVLVDPKKVEFSIYRPLENNFMAEIAESAGDPVITDTDRVKHTLKSLCKEMDDRYLLLQSACCRTIKEYNEKFKARKLNPKNGHHFLPYIVVIIDEFGDLIMVAGKEIEYPITRIAQLARAVGIHMVIATQRPTTNIITGNIKANFPARMAFRVMANIDSRTILDQMGANQLIGRGDMLFLASGKQPERVQCAFIDTPEVEALNSFISKQASPLSAYELPEIDMNDDFDSAGGGDSSSPVERYDSMFVDVARYVVNGQQGSTSAIQRTFSIGYNRAGRLMDQLEKAKIVGPSRGSKPRDVLIMDESDLNAKLEAMHLL
jgi:DNA segregation ATPase FtsK/SpoIIIE, S-DNA-T family